MTAVATMPRERAERLCDALTTAYGLMCQRGGNRRERLTWGLGCRCLVAFRPGGLSLCSQDRKLSLARRQLTDAQKVLVGQKIEPDIAERARLRQVLAGEQHGRGMDSSAASAAELSTPSLRTTDEVAKAVGLGSGDTYDRSKDVIELARTHAPELLVHVENGDWTVAELKRELVGKAPDPSENLHQGTTPPSSNCDKGRTDLQHCEQANTKSAKTRDEVAKAVGLGCDNCRARGVEWIALDHLIQSYRRRLIAPATEVAPCCRPHRYHSNPAACRNRWFMASAPWRTVTAPLAPPSAAAVVIIWMKMISAIAGSSTLPMATRRPRSPISSACRRMVWRCRDRRLSSPILSSLSWSGRTVVTAPRAAAQSASRPCAVASHRPPGVARRGACAASPSAS